MDQWLYSISDHCFDDLTNYRQNCYSSIVDGIVFASDVKRCTFSYFASVSMNAALPVEEAYRILTDEKQNGHLVLLDAKAAFDKVIHSHLFRRMYHAGIQDKINGCILSLITASTILLITGRTVIPR
jgi:hypothetical protein